MIQLPLDVGLRDGATFANYFSGPNLEAVKTLHDVTDHSEKFIYLWGNSATGKTHLLHAACRLSALQGKAPAYLSLTQAQHISQELLEGLEQLALICIDDIQAIAGQPIWETALFHLHNRIRETGARLLITGNASPSNLRLTMPDLSSRLMGGLVLQLHVLDDEGKLLALQLRAQGRGIELPEDVARFLLRRYSRDMPALFELLQRLDQASLITQRKLTIPFVRELMKVAG